MIVRLVLGHLLAIIVGRAVSVRLADRGKLGPALLLISWAFGVAILSLLSFLCLLTADEFPHSYCLIELAIGAAAAYVFWKTKRVYRSETTEVRGRDAVLVGFSALLLLANAVFAVILSIKEPHGAWDGFVIWNAHARFLVATEPGAWRNLFLSRIAHADYPLLVPLAVARLWVWTGSVAPLPAASVSLGFAFATIAALYWFLSDAVDDVRALTGAILLGCTSVFFWNSTAQMADIPLSFFMLTATGAISKAHRTGSNAAVAIAGLATGAAAWTKNEGIAFCAVIALVILARHSFRALREFAFFVAGAALPLAFVTYFKSVLAPGNDLLRGQIARDYFSRLLDPSRYRIVGQAFLREIVTFGSGSIIVLVIVSLVLFAVQRPRARPNKDAAAVLFLMLIAYFSVYVVTPRPLAWHLATSLERLFLQLWPLMIFGGLVSQRSDIPGACARK